MPAIRVFRNDSHGNPKIVSELYQIGTEFELSNPGPYEMISRKKEPLPPDQKDERRIVQDLELTYPNYRWYIAIDSNDNEKEFWGFVDPMHFPPPPYNNVAELRDFTIWVLFNDDVPPTNFTIKLDQYSPENVYPPVPLPLPEL